MYPKVLSKTYSQTWLSLSPFHPAHTNFTSEIMRVLKDMFQVLERKTTIIQKLPLIKILSFTFP